MAEADRTRQLGNSRQTINRVLIFFMMDVFIFLPPCFVCGAAHILLGGFVISGFS
jgi:hypothetical protein